MLKMDNLDDLTYRQLADKARAAINGYFPAWTDQNAHDPGIMLLELFAWLIEMQQYYLNEIKEAEPSFPLLGIKRRRACPAVVRARLTTGADAGEVLHVPAGTPLMAEEIRFETAESFAVGGLSVSAVDSGSDLLSLSRLTVFHPFGISPQMGGKFSILLDQAYFPGHTYTIELVLRTTQSRRNPISPQTPPRLAKVFWEYLSEDGFAELTVSDGTYGLITGGVLRLSVDKPMAANHNGFFEIRCTLLAHEYDISPRIDALVPAVFSAIQKETLCEDILSISETNSFTCSTYLAETGETMVFCESGGEYFRIFRFSKTVSSGSPTVVTVEDSELPKPCSGRFRVLNCDKSVLAARTFNIPPGFPNSRFVADTRGKSIVYEDFSLIISDDHDFRHARKWERVENFYRSLPSDPHYTLDEESGEIRFGNGVNGAIPKGVALIASMSLTEGSGGNIAPGQLTKLDYSGRTMQLEQSGHARGGAERETPDQALKRAKTDICRAVTAEDYEKLIRRTPGLIIDKVKAYPVKSNPRDTFEPFRIIAVVKPPGKGAKLSNAYRTHIREYLEPYRMAGTEIEIVPPVYVNVDIMAELYLRSDCQEGEIEIKDFLRDFFAKRCQDFGAHMQRQDFMSALMELPNVERVVSVSISARSAHAAVSERGELILDPDAFACIGELDLIIR